MTRTNGLMTVGDFLVLIGILGFAIPVFTTQKTEEVARIGDLTIQATQNKSYSIPPLLSGGVLILGLGLIGAGVMQKR